MYEYLFHPTVYICIYIVVHISFFLSFFITCSYSILMEGVLRVLMIKELDWGIVVSGFELQSRYYVHFRTNTLGKGMNSFIRPAMG